MDICINFNVTYLMSHSLNLCTSTQLFYNVEPGGQNELTSSLAFFPPTREEKIGYLCVQNMYFKIHIYLWSQSLNIGIKINCTEIQL